ncbi:MscS Mechanosensitive ion channel [Verrucomicrobia bacterium]|nr:MscS Mechanosensitive ion channel [Verrucomicrobiota bacterium]
MKVKFEPLFRGYILLAAVVLIWSLWAGAQTATNHPATNTAQGATNNRPSVLVTEVERLESHPLTFGLNRVQVLREIQLLGEPLWKYLASLIYILLAFYVSKLIDLVVGARLKKLRIISSSHRRSLILDMLHGPIKVVAFVVLLEIGLSIFEWSEKAKVYLSKGLILVVAGSLTYLAVNSMDLLIDILRQRTVHDADRKFDAQLFSVLQRSLKVFVVIVAVLVTAQNLGVNITAAITSLSIGGLAVGLAAQDTLANLFGAVAVFADRPFRVGDQIKLEGAEGTVEVVGLRSTRLRNPDGHLVTVPNKTMATANITNITERPSIKTVMNVELRKEVPVVKVKRALAILAEVYRAHPSTADVWISFNRFAGPNINIQILHWWKGTDYQKYLTGMQEMNLAIKERFDAEGLSLAETV